MSIRIKAHGLDELSRDFQRAATEAPDEFKKVISKGALNIKNDWRARWSGLAHAPAIPRAITYDIKASGTAIQAEIGPDKAKRQGALGNLLEYGSVNNAPIPGGAPALAAEEPRLAENLENVAVKLIEGAA